jgi:hypothetical protein
MFYNTALRTSSLAFLSFRIPDLIKVRILYRGADKYLAPPGRKEATATEDADFHVSYL